MVVNSNDVNSFTQSISILNLNESFGRVISRFRLTAPMEMVHLDRVYSVKGHRIKAERRLRHY